MIENIHPFQDTRRKGFAGPIELAGDLVATVVRRFSLRRGSCVDRRESVQKTKANINEMLPNDAHKLYVRRQLTVAELYHLYPSGNNISSMVFIACFPIMIIAN